MAGKSNGYLRKGEFDSWASGLGERLDKQDLQLVAITTITQQHAQLLAVFQDRAETARETASIYRKAALSAVGAIIAALVSMAAAAIHLLKP